VTTVYDCGGNLRRRLADLEMVLAGQGWRGFNPSPVTVYQPTLSRQEPWANSLMAETRPPVRATWQPGSLPGSLIARTEL
jgi:hypothetical protein